MEVNHVTEPDRDVPHLSTVRTRLRECDELLLRLRGRVSIDLFETVLSPRHHRKDSDVFVIDLRGGFWLQRDVAEVVLQHDDLFYHELRWLYTLVQYFGTDTIMSRITVRSFFSCLMS